MQRSTYLGQVMVMFPQVEEGLRKRMTMQKPTLKVIGTQYCLVPHPDVTALPSFPVRKIKFFHQNHLWF